jgi:hypothetical protein
VIIGVVGAFFAFGHARVFMKDVKGNWKKCGGMEALWAKMIIFAD